MSASPRDQPSPHQQGSAHSPPAQDPKASISPSNEELQDPEPPSQASDESQQPPHAPFEPVFTLLTNTTTNTTTHPRVHYIFSDDDPSILSTLDPSRRALLIDLIPSQPSASASPAPAWSVSWAASLTPDFAITSSRLTEQQQDVSGGASGDAMLRLEGVEREPVELKQLPQQRMEDSDEQGAPLGLEQEDQEGLVEDFKRRMGVLQKVIDEAQKREVVVARDFENEEEEEDNEEAVGSGQRGDDDVRHG